MEFYKRFQSAIFIFFIFLMLGGCKKEEAPTVTTNSVSNVTAVTAIGGGTITDEGSSTVTSRGVCWSTNPTPTISDSKTSDGAGAGNFVSNLSGLSGATNYFIRAYATNNAGTGYGMALSFNTLGQSPSPSISLASDVTDISATLNGVVNANYLSTVVTFEYGITNNYGNSVSANQSPVTGSTNINVSANITGLTLATEYYYRIKSVNSLGTTYSGANKFKTLGQTPIISTQLGISARTNGVVLTAIVNPNYASTEVTFEFGLTTNYGRSVTAAPKPITGHSDLMVSGEILELTAGTSYHYRVKAVNILGTTYSNDYTFTTLGQVPSVNALPVTNITTTSAILNGTVNPNYLESTITFEYGSTTNYGNSVTANQSPISGYNTVNINSSLTGLTGGVTYHYRVKASNSLGTSYTNDNTFKTLGQVPNVTTLAASDIKSTGVTLNGNVNANFLETSIYFEYGTTTDYGSSVTAIQSPVSGNSSINISTDISGLILGNTYHFRIKAVNSLGTSYGNDMSFSYLYHGALYQGGLIFYIDNTGQHGLISAPSDQATAVWGCSGIYMGTGEAIGAGNQNTTKIINGCSTIGIAAKVCSDLEMGGYSDWFLPSKDELGLMYSNLKVNGLGSFSTVDYYWSSSEVNGTYVAWMQYFNDGNKTFTDRSNTGKVRAIRAF